VFENRVLRRIFGPKRDEVTGGRRKLHNEELHNLHSSLSIIRMIKSRGMSRQGMLHGWGRRGMHIGYWCESQKERNHWEDQDLREIEWDGMDWIDVAQDRDQWRVLVITVMNLRVP
jgi:hypothetical protein